MMKWQTLARWGLFGKVGGKSKPPWWGMLLGDGLYMVAGIDTGLPSLIDRIEYYIDVLYSALFGEDDSLPHDFPAKLYSAIEKVLHNRGGFFDEGQPNFYCKRAACSSTLLMWTVQVEYAPTADPAKLHAMENSIEEALTRSGFDYNVRILSRPLRIEIDKPDAPVVNLSDYWSAIGALPRNELYSVAGVTVSDKGLVLYSRRMKGESYSARIVGRPRSGKTQLALALLLSMAYTNSPAVLSMVVIDPKVIDMMFLNGLSHLAVPVATRNDECLAVLRAAVGEMERREEALRAGDRSFLGKRIMVYVDEMADLQAVFTGNEREEIVTLVQRLTQRGGAYGFIVVGATQRVYEVDARMYTKMNDRYALAANSGSDGYAATGVAGVQVHKLPGSGACEVYPDGTRIQGFFVADAEADDYEQRIGRYLMDIKQRWDGVLPCWSMGEEVDNSVSMAEFMNYLRENSITGIHAIRRAHRLVMGTGIGADKAREIQEELTVP